jgi:hypothetical protein
VYFAAINFPGSWADGSLTAIILHYMKRKFGAFKICVDQGFPRSGAAYGTFVGPVTKPAKHLLPDVCNYLLKISNVHTLLWQVSKWGMRGLQGTFSSYKNCLPSNSPQCCLVLKAIILGHNSWTNYVDYSLIKTVFNRDHVCSQNLHGYDRIAQYYFCPGEYNSQLDKAGDGAESENCSNNE